MLHALVVGVIGCSVSLGMIWLAFSDVVPSSLHRVRRRWARSRTRRLLRPAWLFGTAFASLFLAIVAMGIWHEHADGRPYQEAAASLTITITAVGATIALLALFTAIWQNWRTTTPPDLRVFLLPKEVAKMTVIGAENEFQQYLVPPIGLVNYGPGSVRVNRISFAASFRYTDDWRDDAIRRNLGSVIPSTLPPPPIPRWSEETSAVAPADWQPLPNDPWQTNRWELRSPFTIRETPPLLVIGLGVDSTTQLRIFDESTTQAILRENFVLSISVQIDTEHRFFSRTLEAPVVYWHRDRLGG